MLINAFRSLMMGQPLDWLQVFLQILASLLVILLVLPLHECAHAWVAVKLGDDTPRWQKRLTLNPLVSLDPMGSLGILLFGIGWAKPVQINARNFKNPKAGMAITAAAGPVSNLAAALVGMLLGNMMFLFRNYISYEVYFYVLLFLQYYVLINISLAAFNLLPIPPLDGSRILAAFLPGKMMFTYYKYQNYITLGLFVLLFLGVLDVPLAWLRSVMWDGLGWIADLPFKAFGVF